MGGLSRSFGSSICDQKALYRPQRTLFHVVVFAFRPDDYAAVVANAHCAVDPGGGQGYLRLVYGEKRSCRQTPCPQYRLTGIWVSLRVIYVSMMWLVPRVSVGLFVEIHQRGQLQQLGVYTLIHQGITRFMAGTDVNLSICLPHMGWQ